MRTILSNARDFWKNVDSRSWLPCCEDYNACLALSASGMRASVAIPLKVVTQADSLRFLPCTTRQWGSGQNFYILEQVR